MLPLDIAFSVPSFCATLHGGNNRLRA